MFQRRLTRVVLCVGFLGSAATLLLRPTSLVTGVALGIFAGCLLAVVVRALRRAARCIDRIMSEELGPDEEPRPDGKPADTAARERRPKNTA
jgi:hypothetical protein